MYLWYLYIILNTNTVLFDIIHITYSCTYYICSKNVIRVIRNTYIRNTCSGPPGTLNISTHLIQSHHRICNFITVLQGNEQQHTMGH
jgi:hypothetical protein